MGCAWRRAKKRLRCFVCMGRFWIRAVPFVSFPRFHRSLLVGRCGTRFSFMFTRGGVFCVDVGHRWVCVCESMSVCSRVRRFLQLRICDYSLSLCHPFLSEAEGRSLSPAVASSVCLSPRLSLCASVGCRFSGRNEVAVRVWFAFWFLLFAL